MAIETMSSENFHSRNATSRIFWIFIFFMTCFFSWAYFFELEKSVVISGQVKPMGFPILVQSRFEAKVKAVSVSEGEKVKKDDVLVQLEKNIDESELYELEFLMASSAMKIARLEAQLREKTKFTYEVNGFEKFVSVNDEMIEAIFLEQSEILLSEMNFLSNEVNLISTQRKVKQSEIFVLDSNILALESDLILASKKFLLTENLFDKNFVGELDLLEAVSEKTSVQKALTENLTQKELKQNELLLLEDELKNVKAEFRKKTLLNLVEEKEKFRNSEIRSDGVLNKLDEYLITAPVSGIISNVGAENAGQILSVGTTVAEIIPENTPFVFYGELPVQHINDVTLGQNVILTLSNFDQRTDDVLMGAIIEIAEDTTAKENGEPHYQIIVEFSDLKKARGFLKSGLTGTGSVLFGRTNVFGYYFEPIWKTFRFALTEV